MNTTDKPNATLALGTVQFGLDYGITNQSGKLPQKVVAGIMKVARENSITLLDTASAYGESEEVLGRLGEQIQGFSIMTKTPGWNGAPQDDCLKTLTMAFGNSLQKLGRNRVWGIMVHLARDLLSDQGPRIWDALREIKASGKAEKIGISFYADDPVDEIVEIFRPDFVQVPINALDQRLVINDTLRRLHSSGVEIHARSVFLQGILLSRASSLPTRLKDLEKPLQSFTSLCELSGLTRLEGAFSFVHSIKEISRIIVGVTSTMELENICAAHSSAGVTSVDWHDANCDNPELVDPRYWPTK